LGVTERSAYGIVADLTTAGYLAKLRDGRRNRYQIQAHLPLPEPASREPTIGEVLSLLAGLPVATEPESAKESSHETHPKPAPPAAASRPAPSYST
jgi:hypothetical protein